MVRVFNLLKSVRPTGMAEAGNGLLEVVPGATEAPWSRDAQALNDAPIPAAARTVLRFLLAQASPLSGGGSVNKKTVPIDSPSPEQVRLPGSYPAQWG